MIVAPEKPRAKKPMGACTAGELSQMQDTDRYELVRGELIEMAPPPGPDHGFTTVSLITEVNYFVRRNRLGYGFTSETGFLLARDPDTVLAPDFAFVRMDRVTRPFAKPYLALCPDLVVETISPSTTRREAAFKTDLWLRFGAKLVWILDPEDRTLTVYKPVAPFRILTVNDTVTGEGILPEFSMPVREVFELP